MRGGAGSTGSTPGGSSSPIPASTAVGSREFRTRLVAGAAGHQLLDTLLAPCRERGLLHPRGRQRTDSTHVLAAIRAMHRLECVVETLRHALPVLALAAPAWRRAHREPSWGARSAQRHAQRPDDEWRPKTEAKRAAYARAVGEDGHRLLARRTGAAAPTWRRELPAVEVLRQIWVPQFYVDAAGGGGTGARPSTGCRRPAPF